MIFLPLTPNWDFFACFMNFKKVRFRKVCKAAHEDHAYTLSMVGPSIAAIVKGDWTNWNSNRIAEEEVWKVFQT